MNLLSLNYYLHNLHIIKYVCRHATVACYLQFMMFANRFPTIFVKFLVFLIFHSRFRSKRKVHNTRKTRIRKMKKKFERNKQNSLNRQKKYNIKDFYLCKQYLPTIKYIYRVIQIDKRCFMSSC